MCVFDAIDVSVYMSNSLCPLSCKQDHVMNLMSLLPSALS